MEVGEGWAGKEGVNAAWCLHDLRGDVREVREETDQFDVVVGAGSLLLDVVPLACRVLAPVAQGRDRVVLREEGEAERVRLPPDDCDVWDLSPVSRTHTHLSCG